MRSSHTLFHAVSVHFIRQSGDAFRRGELRNSVTEVEYMARTRSVCVKYAASFAAHFVGRRKKYRRIEIALERDLRTHALLRCLQVGAPVDPQCIAAGFRHVFHPMPAALREQDAWDAPSVVFL